MNTLTAPLAGGEIRIAAAAPRSVVSSSVTHKLNERVLLPIFTGLSLFKIF